jgi:NHLM bacteriocin system ABC transporter ATP-binding protein
VTAPVDLSHLPAPARLQRAARLYGVVLDGSNLPGARHFLAELPAGGAVFKMAAPRVAFLLADSDEKASEPMLAESPIDATAIEAWCTALLSYEGLPRGGGAAVTVEPGRRFPLKAGSQLTARQVVWLKANAATLRYAAPPNDGAGTAQLLVAGHQIGVEATQDGEVAAVATDTLLESLSPAELGAQTAGLAACIARDLIARDAAEQNRWQEVTALDNADAAAALQRLTDIAAFRSTPIVSAGPGAKDALTGALSVLAASEGIELRLPADDGSDTPLFQRLESIANASAFHFREIALTGRWWTEDGPPFLGVDASTNQPLAVIRRRGRWRIVDPQTGGETAIDEKAAASLQPRAYMIYATLPERLTLRQLWQFAVFGVRAEIVRLLLASAAVTLAGLLLPVATGAILGVAVPEGRMTLLTDMIVLLVAVAVGGAGFQVSRALALVRLGTHIDRRLQAAVWDRVIRLRTDFFRGYSVGDLALRILGIDSIRRLLSGVTLTGIVSGAFSLASLGLMLVYDGALAAFAVAYALIAGLLMFGLGRAQLRLQRIVYQRKGIVSALLIEILGGIAKLRIAAAELRAFSRWSTAFAAQRASDARSGRVDAFQTVIAGSLPFFGALGIFAIAAGGGHPVDMASFAAFNGAFGQFTVAILTMVTAINASVDVIPLFARLRPVLEAPLEVEHDRSDPGRLGGSLAVRNLSFRYAADGPWVLEDVTIEAQPGEFVAIVGASGSGKSTLLRQLLGFETPARGGVFYDGKDLAKLDRHLVRRQIGTVLDTAKLVPGSLYQNIAGSAPLSHEQVMDAARQAGLDADIAAMPMGFESFVMEGGGQLSGGQRQRVMIARALVGKPRLIFFDEATSALDNRTQAIVGESLAALNATRVIIAHRLSTVLTADRVYVLERGRVVESGRCEDLLARDSAFRRLAQRQML